MMGLFATKSAEKALPVFSDSFVRDYVKMIRSDLSCHLCTLSSRRMSPVFRNEEGIYVFDSMLVGPKAHPELLTDHTIITFLLPPKQPSIDNLSSELRRIVDETFEELNGKIVAFTKEGKIIPYKGQYDFDKKYFTVE